MIAQVWRIRGLRTGRDTRILKFSVAMVIMSVSAIVAIVLIAILGFLPQSAFESSFGLFFAFRYFVPGIVPLFLMGLLIFYYRPRSAPPDNGATSRRGTSSRAKSAASVQMENSPRSQSTTSDRVETETGIMTV